MKESEYIAATNLTRCRILLSVLREMSTTDHITEVEQMEVASTIHRWQNESLNAVGEVGPDD